MLKLISVAGLLMIVYSLTGFRQTDSWMGKWVGEHPEGVTYTIRVNDQYRGMNLCEVNAEGIQTSYTLECRAIGTPTTLKVYFRSTTKGAFYADARVKVNEPLFILKREKGRITWQWQQIFDGKMIVHKAR